MTDKKFESTAMPTVDDEINLSRIPSKKPKKLSLDDKKGYRPAKTRAELYREMEEEDKKFDSDVIEYTSPVKRGGALIIDLAFIYVVVDIALRLAPYELAIMQHFLDLYKHQFIFTPQAMLESLDIFNVTAAIFFTLLLPLSFFNTSLGKKIMKLRVRGDQAYTISLSKAFQRELIFKPLSMILIVGFIMPFFNEKQQSLHDKMAGTIVIKD